MAGTLDTTFGTNGGWTPSPFYNSFRDLSSSLTYSSVIDSTGRILVTGQIVDTNGLQSLFVARYTIDGLLDTTFGEGAKGWTVTTFISGANSSGTSIAVDSNDKILVTGFILDTDTIQKTFVARYTISGLLDNTFGEGSKGWTATTFISGANSGGISIAVDSNDKILVTGVILDTDNIQKTFAFVARYTISGLLDNSFGEGSKGWTATTFISGANSQGTSIAVDSNDKILVTGFILDTDNIQKTFVARYTISGLLDNSFGEGAKGWTATTFISGKNSQGFSIAVDSNDKILVTGFIIDTDNIQKTFVARYTSIGILDNSFGEGSKGWTATTFISGEYSSGTSIAVDSTGKIVVVGLTGSSNVGQILVFVARYLSEPNIEPICLPAGTPILTDQGLVNIELIDPKKHTIGHKRIVAITKTITPEKHLICFEKYTLGLNTPTKRTMMTPGHEVLYKGKLVQAKHFLGRLDGVRAVPYKGDVLYNVLQEKHGLMSVNNMVLETLHPENKVAKEILRKDRDL